MNPFILKLLGNSLKNPRTSIAGILYAIGKWGCPALATWMPQYKSKLDTTADILEGAAVWYGFTQTVDAAKSLTKEEGLSKAEGLTKEEGLTKVEAQTTFLAKADVNKTT